MGTRYDVGLAHLEIAGRLGKVAPQERDHLEKAESIFVELGAELDLRRSRELFESLSPVHSIA